MWVDVQEGFETYDRDRHYEGSIAEIITQDGEAYCSNQLNSTLACRDDVLLNH